MAILSAVNNSKENKVHVEVVEVSDYAMHWITLKKFFVCVCGFMTQVKLCGRILLFFKPKK